MNTPEPSPRSSRPRVKVIAFATACAAGLAGVWAAVAPAQDLHEKLEKKESRLSHANERKGVLSTEIERYSNRISRLEGEVAELRNREAALQEELEAAEAELRRARHRLQVVRERLRSAIKVLEQRLVEIYKSDDPDALTVVLESDGFDDLLERTEYLNRIEEMDSDVVARVRELRNEAKATVERIEEVRDAIAARKRELTQTRVELEQQEAALSAARNEKQSALSQVRGHVHRLEGDISGLEDKIQAQLAAAAAAEQESSAAEPLKAGPVQEGSSGSGFIWPVSGPVSSPYGQRWGRLHAGIDIAVPAGTPIRAAASGTIALASAYGGYGNYTCIEHGGGLSTCYAHQSSFAITSGSVGQGDVIGYVGCTGSCFGDHLHFEVRVGGSPVDPLGYL